MIGEADEEIQGLRQAARVAGRSVAGLRKLMARGGLACRRDGDGLVFRRSDLAAIGPARRPSPSDEAAAMESPARQPSPTCEATPVESPAAAPQPSSNEGLLPSLDNTQQPSSYRVAMPSATGAPGPNPEATPPPSPEAAAPSAADTAVPSPEAEPAPAPSDADKSQVDDASPGTPMAPMSEAQGETEAQALTISHPAAQALPVSEAQPPTPAVEPPLESRVAALEATLTEHARRLAGVFPRLVELHIENLMLGDHVVRSLEAQRRDLDAVRARIPNMAQVLNAVLDRVATLEQALQVRRS